MTYDRLEVSWTGFQSRPPYIGIGIVAAPTTRASKGLRESSKTLPGRLHALSNEVSDVVTKWPQSLKFEPKVQAGSKLSELRIIVESLTENCKTFKIPIFRVHAWRKNQPRLQTLQEDIKMVKCSLHVMLGASNSQDMMRIQVNLEKVSTVSSHSAQFQRSM